MNNAADSFARHVASSGGASVYFVRGMHRGVHAWYYVRVTRQQAQKFERAVAGGSFDLADCSTVLASGYGDVPAQDIRLQFGDETHLEEDEDQNSMG